ncbi:MAG TPA: hypothetical protein DDX19_04980 [Rhodopirellula baltica]|nr:hypothetical protein [Rhodopirellula baltica]
MWWSRYAIATILSPMLIVLAVWFLPGMLRGLVLLRTVRTELTLGDHTIADSLFRTDLSWLTWLNAMNVAFGIATYRLVRLHWQSRSRHYFAGHASQSDELPTQFETQTLNESGKFHIAGWPILGWFVWFSMSLIYPIVASRETIADQLSADAMLQMANANGASWSAAVVGIGIGLFAALASLLLLAFIRALCGGADSRSSGMFPGEEWARHFASWILPTLMSKHRLHRLKLPIHIHGVTDAQTKVLLPGHLQLLIGLLLSVTVYFVWLWQSIHADLWNVPKWPVGFYLLVLIFLTGRFVSLIAFLFDRYRIPVGLAILAWMLVVSDKQRYFELLSVQEANFTKLDRPPSNTGHNLIDALAQRPESSSDYPDPPYLYDLYDEYHFPRWGDGKRTCVVVSASGGGIQAAAWTSKVLTSLEAEIEPFGESIGLISSVSGGSVGTMHYLANRYPRVNDINHPPMSPSANQLLLNARSNASSLEAIGWGMAFPDFSRLILPFKLDGRADRGWALEGSWWNRLGRTEADASWMSEVRVRDLVQPTIDGKFPPVVFNATAVETGQRVLISQVKGRAVPPEDSRPNQYDGVNMPIDFLDFYGSIFTEPTIVNPRLTTAVRLSATFAYVTPAALPLPVDDGQIAAPELRSRLDIHLCDGGYADNTGLVSAISMFQDLITRYDEDMKNKRRKTAPFDRVLFVRIEPFPPSVAQATYDNRGTKSAFFGPLTALAATRTSSQAERANLELSLLMNTSSEDFIEHQQSTARDIDQLLQQVQEASVRAEAEVDPEKHQRLHKAIMDLQTDSIEKSLDGVEIDVSLERHMRAFQLGLRQSDPEKMKAPAVKEIARAIDQILERQQQSTEEQGSSIEVLTALFRFDTRSSKPEDSEGTSSYSPPLSWRLSQTDLAAIEVAWKRHEKALHRNDTVATASSGRDTESKETPWITESLPQSKSLSPREMLNLSK